MIRVLFVNAISNRASSELLRKGVYEGLLNSKTLQENPRSLELLSFDCFEGAHSPLEMASFAKANGVQAVVLSGSDKNTSNKADPWIPLYLAGLRKLLNFSEDAPEDWDGPEYPTLGICFGHQALAVALGGDTSRFSRRVAQMDIESLEPAKTHPVFSDILKAKGEINVIVTHGDHVTSLPPGFNQTFRSDYCEIHGMAHENFPIVSLQSHPEITEEFSRHPHGLKGWENIQHERVKHHDGPKILGAFLNWAIQKNLERAKRS